MAEQKIFAGPRIRRLRMERGLTQTAMAEGLGISPSYLNLIERNQRPLTVQLLLKLASVYRVDPHELQAETRGSVAALKEVFSDPLLVAELPGDQELVEFAEAAPNAAAAMQKLFRAYREQAARLSDLNALLAGEGRAAALSGARLPLDELRDTFERRPWHFPVLEEAVESFLADIAPEDDLFSTLKAWLRREHGIGVKMLPAATMPNWRRRYDRHSQRLFVSDRLSRADRLREVATEACLLRLRDVLAAEVAALKLSTEEARRLARFELARYAALALMLPYARFRQAAVRARYDIAVLAARFDVSFEQAATRLVSLQKPGSAGVPFFLIEVDVAGNRLRRIGAQDFPHAAFGGACPKLPVHDVFAEPGRVLAEAVEMPDGASFLCIARTVEGPQGGFDERPRRTALLVGCDLARRDELVYGTALSPSVTLAGPACRLCERAGCLARAEPPVTRPLGLDESVAGLSAFDFQ
jgi:predicted transcriptional regulator/DNA-binding XRE family transcriptional regulator